MTKPTTFVRFLIDRSGSMSHLRSQVVKDINEKMAELKSAALDTNQEFLITLSFFSTGPVVTKYYNTPVSDVKDLHTEDYVPDGGTAMLDAFGAILAENLQLGEKDAVLINVISDGEENSSTSYTYERVKSLVKDREATGRYTFTYMGTNQDLLNVANKIGINPSNVAQFDALNYAMNAHVHTVGIRNYARSSRTMGATSVSSNFFAGSGASLNNDGTVNLSGSADLNSLVGASIGRTG